MGEKQFSHVKIPCSFREINSSFHHVKTRSQTHDQMTFTSTSRELSRDIYGSLVLNTPNNLVFFTNFCLLGSLYTEDFFNWYMILCNTLLVAKVSFTRLTAKFNKIMYFYLPMQYRLIAIYSYQDVLIMLFETLSGHLVKRFFW